jgi:hypothetical protein
MSYRPFSEARSFVHTAGLNRHASLLKLAVRILPTPAGASSK